MTAPAVAHPTGIVGETVDDVRRTIRRVTFRTSARNGLMRIGSAAPGDARPGRVTRRAIADTRIGMEHPAHKHGRLRGEVAVGAGLRRGGMAEGDESSPALAARDMTFPAIAAAPVNDRDARSRLNRRRRTIDRVAGQARRVSESGVIGNAPGQQRVGLLVRGSIQAPGESDRRYQEDTAQYRPQQ